MVQQELYRAKWRKSRYCDGGTCIEVAQTQHGLVAVRDSTNPSGSAVVFTPAGWSSFLNQAKRIGIDADPARSQAGVWPLGQARTVGPPR